MPPTRRSDTLSSRSLCKGSTYLSERGSYDSLTSRDAEGESDTGSIILCEIQPASISAKGGKGAKSSSAKQKPSLSSITIEGVVLKPTAVFDAFWYWAAERKAMDDRRRSGQAAPWTDDPILQKYFFCNTYRVLDKVTQFIITDVIQKGPQDPTEVVFRVVLFNSFTKIDTWNLLQEELGPLRWSDYSREKYQAVLSQAFKAKQSLYTGAFIKPAPHFGYDENYMNHLCLLENLMENELPYKLLGAPSLADVYEYLISFPAMGDFTTYQLMLNLSYTNVLNFHANDFVITGPGSLSGLDKMFGRSFQHALADDKDFGIKVMRWLVETQDHHFQRLGLDFSGLGPKKLPMDVSDVEHAICEVDKYARAKFPAFKGKRTHLRRVYTPSSTPYPAKPALPEAWEHPARAVPKIRPGPLVIEKRYEINYIGNHRTGDQGLEFHVFWMGYPNKDATWEPELSLMADAPVIVKEYLAKSK